MNNTLIIAGNNKHGRKLIAAVEGKEGVKTLVDDSFSSKKLWKIIIKKKIYLLRLFKIFFAELMRKDTRLENAKKIRTNKELLSFCKTETIDEIILFRASLIIAKKAIDVLPNIYNVHCVRLPEYAGLGGIHRALKKRDYEQMAVMHRVVKEIDQGEAIRQVPYRLDPQKTYRENEDIAYEAGMQLIFDYLERRK